MSSECLPNKSPPTSYSVCVCLACLYVSCMPVRVCVCMSVHVCVCGRREGLLFVLAALLVYSCVSVSMSVCVWQKGRERLSLTSVVCTSMGVKLWLKHGQPYQMATALMSNGPSHYSHWPPAGLQGPFSLLSWLSPVFCHGNGKWTHIVVMQTANKDYLSTNYCA